MNQHVGTLVAERPAPEPLQALLNDRQLQADLDKAEAAAETALLEEQEAKRAEALAAAEQKRLARNARRRELYAEQKRRESQHTLYLSQRQHYEQCDCSPSNRFGRY